MTQLDLALRDLYTAVNDCMHVAEFHIPIRIATACLAVRELIREGECEVCHDGEPVQTSP